MLSTFHNAFPCAFYVLFWKAVTVVFWYDRNGAAIDQQVNLYFGWHVMEPDLSPNETTSAHILLCSGQFFSICFYHYRCYFLLGLRVLKYYLSDKSKSHICLCSWDIWLKCLGLSTCDNDSSWDTVVARPHSQGADRNKLIAHLVSMTSTPPPFSRADYSRSFILH